MALSLQKRRQMDALLGKSSAYQGATTQQPQQQPQDQGFRIPIVSDIVDAAGAGIGAVAEGATQMGSGLLGAGQFAGNVATGQMQKPIWVYDTQQNKWIEQSPMEASKQGVRGLTKMVEGGFQTAASPLTGSVSSIASQLPKELADPAMGLLAMPENLARGAIGGGAQGLRGMLGMAPLDEESLQKDVIGPLMAAGELGAAATGAGLIPKSKIGSKIGGGVAKAAGKVGQKIGDSKIMRAAASKIDDINIPGAVKRAGGLADDMTGNVMSGLAGKADDALARFRGRDKTKSILDPLIERGKKKVGDKLELSTGKVLQEMAEEVPYAGKYLAQAGRGKKIKSYKDLSNFLQSKLDDIYPKAKGELSLYNSNLRKMDDLGTQIPGVSKKVNYVEKALDDLEDWYDITEDALALENIKNLREKAKTKGLSPLEINEIAIEYGFDFKDRAFNKKGDFKDTARAARTENIRKGLKSTVKETVPSLSGYDRNMFELKSTKTLVDLMKKKAGKAELKVDELGLGGKVVEGVIGGLDRKSGGAVQGAVRALNPMTIGKRQSLNSLQIQQNLPKYLKDIARYTDMVEAGGVAGASPFLDKLSKIPIKKLPAYREVSRSAAERDR